MRSSECLVLCQSEAVLRRPYCLIERATAVDAGIPIVGVALGKEYDFGAAARFLSQLDTLLEVENPGPPKMLAENGITDLVALSHKLSSTIPNIISIELNPSASRNVLNASLADVRDAMASATPTSLPEFDQWLAARGAPDAAAAARGRPRQGCAREEAPEPPPPPRLPPPRPRPPPRPPRTPSGARRSSARPPTRRRRRPTRRWRPRCASSAAAWAAPIPHRRFGGAHDRGSRGGGARGEAAGDDEGARGVVAVRLVMDGSWKEASTMMAVMATGAKGVHFVALQGFVDPDGAYALVHVEHGAEVPMTGMDANQGGATPWADFDAAQAKLIKTVEDETTAAVRPAYDAPPPRPSRRSSDGGLCAHRADLLPSIW